MILLAGSFLALLLFGVPVAFAMLVAGILYLWTSESIDVVIVPQQLVDGIDSFPLLAVPFFVLTGVLMNASGVTQRLVDLARALIGHIRGGLAHALIATGMLMAGVSGSGTADAAALGGVMIPAMKKDRYDPAFAVALSACAGAVGPIIPPSIILIIYGHLGNVSVGRLFLAGAVPGLLMGIYLMAVSYGIARWRGYGPRTRRAPISEQGRAVARGALDLLLPVIIIGGIVGGIFTATEAGAVAAAYVLFIGAVIYRTLDFRKLYEAFIECIVILGSVMLTIAAAAIIHYILALVQAADQVGTFFASLSDNPLMFLLAVNLLLLGLGCVVEVTAVLVLMTPVLVPALSQFGIDPVHFGLVMALNLTIGLLTPPVGLAMYVTCAIGDVSIEQYARACWPFLAALLALLVLVAVVPELTLWLPRTVMGR
jgi:C4-dicarboxylate transporter DctM subunit